MLRQILHRLLARALSLLLYDQIEMNCRILFALSLVLPAFAQTGCEKVLDEWRRLIIDFGGLNRYGSDNTEVRPPAAGEKRVVFLGDEITEEWSSDDNPFFPGRPYHNRGIARQTTSQMLLRFRQDVITLKPAAVVIQGGSNDLAGFTGPATQGTIAENIMSMVDLAKANGIRVVIASITPVCDCDPNLKVSHTRMRPPGKLIGLNGWTKEFAEQAGAVYLDYYSALVEGRSFKKELTADGLVPNRAGYAVMAPLAEAAIARALAGK